MNHTSKDQTTEEKVTEDGVSIETDKTLPQIAGVTYGGVKVYVFHPRYSNLWQAKMDRGDLPESLKGSWTTRAEALKAVEFYLKNTMSIPNTSKNREAVKNGEQPKRTKPEPAKRKPKGARGPAKTNTD